jgi:hypothetical protein
MKQALIIASIAVICLSGCMPRYNVIVSSVTKPSLTEIKRNYYLVADFALKEQGITEGNLLFVEFKQLVNRVLASRGFVEVDVLNTDLSKLPLSDYPVSIFLDYKTEPFRASKVMSTLAIRSLDLSEVISTGGKIAFSEGKFNLVGGDWTWSWVTVAMTSDSSGDIQRDFPILLAAMKPYMATRTGKMVEIRLAEDDERVIEIKELLFKKQNEFP